MRDEPMNRGDDRPDEAPFDLSPLDPMRDEPRWRAVVDRTLARVDAVVAERARREDPLDLIASWRRPLLVAAAAAIALLVPAELALERREARARRVERLVAVSSRVAQGAAPTGADFRRALSGPPARVPAPGGTP
jgi:hypothetical protein